MIRAISNAKVLFQLLSTLLDFQAQYLIEFNPLLFVKYLLSLDGSGMAFCLLLALSLFRTLSWSQVEPFSYSICLFMGYGSKPKYSHSKS